MVVAPDPKSHCDGMADLIAKAFRDGPNFWRQRDACRRYILREPFYDLEATRIGVIDGRIVTHWGVFGYAMRIGLARIRVGGGGGVVTHGEFRKRGLMARTGCASIEAMRELGYDMTILFGLRNFYHRFGYVDAWAEASWTVKVAELPTDRPTAKLRRFAPHHRDDIAEIYNREHSTFTGTAVRPTYLHRSSPDDWRGYLWTDGRGRTAGYVVLQSRGKGIECIESSGDVEEALRVLGMLARRGRYEQVRFASLPYGHPLCRSLRRGNSHAEFNYSRDGGAMIRTLNLRAMLRKMTGELSRRLKGSPLSGWRGGLLIADPREKVKLAIDRSRVRVCAAGRSSDTRPARHTVRGGEEIAQLLIGTDEPGEIVEAANIKLAGDARKLVNVLFPNQHPILSVRDRY